ncbi:MAG: hypothetical protein ACKO2L_20760 [Planctomycetaceae bacterium]
MTKPVNWSRSNMLWELKSIDFLARAPQVARRFTSDSNGFADERRQPTHGSRSREGPVPGHAGQQQRPPRR